MDQTSTMLTILESRLVEDLHIKSVRETATKYIIKFQYENDITTAELPKCCPPGCHDVVADRTIITAMSTIYFNREDYINAKKWLDKLISA